MRAPIDQIMDLQDVDVVGFEQPKGLVDLRFALSMSMAPNLGRKLKTLLATLGGQADHPLALAVHR